MLAQVRSKAPKELVMWMVEQLQQMDVRGTVEQTDIFALAEELGNQNPVFPVVQAILTSIVGGLPKVSGPWRADARFYVERLVSVTHVIMSGHQSNGDNMFVFAEKARFTTSISQDQALQLLPMLFTGLAAVATTGTPRGIRNHNPGNIKFSERNGWVGKLAYMPVREATFERFDTAENGLRAMAKLLRNYMVKHKCDTVAKIVGRWAPPHENMTSKYARAVAHPVSGGDVDAKLVADEGTLVELMDAMITQEVGRHSYSRGQLEGAAKAACGP